MLLRRISEHVKDQNWFAIVIDFFIVVVGVFIGIQVSNWNASRQEEQKAQVYVERIREDLTGNLTDFNDRKAYFLQVRKHALAVLEALDKTPEQLGEQFLIDVYQASQVIPRKLGRDTYDEILSVGALNSDNNIAVRKRLANFYRSLHAQLSNLQTAVPYRELVRSKMPYKVQAAVRKACDDIVSTGQTGEPIISLPDSCTLELTSEEISEAVLVTKNTNIRDELIHRLNQLDTSLIGIQLILDRVLLLDAYLKTIK